MSPDEFQQAWQAGTSKTRINFDADTLLKEVQRSQREFRTAILIRDYREVGVALVMLPAWVIMGYALSLPWTWYLVMIGIVWGIVFILVDRWRHKHKLPGPNEPLLISAKESLTQVEHQIWLLRNIVWWYLLPYALPMFVFFVDACRSTGMSWPPALVVASLPSLFVALLYAFLYVLNQREVRKRLEPRRQELLSLIASLTDETTGEVSGAYPILTGKSSYKSISPRRTIIATLVALILLAIGIGGIFVFANLDDDSYEKLAPFTDVRWAEDAPVVEIDGEWHLLFSIDGTDVKDIVAFCQRTYGDKWQKRFGEDLVQVLTEMGQKPRDTVKLDVLSTATPVARTTKDVAMTSANRRAVRAAAEKREFSEQQLEEFRAKSRNEPFVPLAKLIPTLRQENKLVGLAAMVVVDGKLVGSAVDGDRKARSGVQLSIGDQWHLGSITKSITATMIARLVEAGKMQWTDTVGACFPNEVIHDDWKLVTLRQLLTHTSGAPANFSVSVRRKKPALGPECTQARREAVLNVMAGKPEHAPGTEFAYSNVGFTIAGAMAEQATGETWEDLVKREVFEPLALESAGFGPPKSLDKKLEQPQGHTTAFGWKVAAGEDADNTFIIGPAGIVHMTLEDLCTYATEHLRGELGQGTLLSAETYKLLHTPELDDYACGWVKKGPTANIPYDVYWHNGSNTMWYALVAFIPETKTVVAVTSNDGDIARAEAAAWRIVQNSARSSKDAEQRQTSNPS
ncbi:MAG: beta-lactamase family protein [Candidatus Hydrogenedentes bacterium]|nr:beta-lactamase family protein [Candidatus Hydrogenedentota bacterium]